MNIIDIILGLAFCRLALCVSFEDRFAAYYHLDPDARSREFGPGLAKRALPFNRIIAFGDDYTDNSQGSFAHGITGDPKTGAGKLLWGYGTWTDGYVAVQWLSTTTGLPLVYDYAFGSSLGAQKVGAVCNISAVSSTQLGGYARLLDGTIVPDVLSQIQNYTSNPTTKANIANTLHVLWIGNNDVLGAFGTAGRFVICADGRCTASQTSFLAGMNTCIGAALTNLINAGAKYILVPDIFPRHLTPFTSQFVTSNASYIANFGSVIDQANANINATINNLNSRYAGVQIRYFPANSYIKSAVANPISAGIASGYPGRTAPGYVNTCVDGCITAGPSNTTNWNLYWSQTVLKKTADYFVWMTAVVMSATLHKALGWNMAYYVYAVFT